MGKRSNFERIDKDLYRTFDPRAGNALRPHLPRRCVYAEPCCGHGDLIKNLGRFAGIRCGLATDIAEPYCVDALGLHERALDGVDMIITNPPWTHPILHALIEHFAKLRPTWLLFDADWAHTKQSVDLQRKYCVQIVSVGRLIWIPGTTTSGKDNCAWYLFDARKDSEIIFQPRAA